MFAVCCHSETVRYHDNALSTTKNNSSFCLPPFRLLCHVFYFICGLLLLLKPFCRTKSFAKVTKSCRHFEAKKCFLRNSIFFKLINFRRKIILHFLSPHLGFPAFLLLSHHHHHHTFIVFPPFHLHIVETMSTHSFSNSTQPLCLFFVL